MEQNIDKSLGPKEILLIVKGIIRATDLPVKVQANPGLPSMSFGETIYDITSEGFLHWVNNFVKDGVSIISGCCVTILGYGE